MSITLTLSNLSVVITKFASPRFPRIRAIEGAKVEYSNNGNTIGDGPTFEPPHLWAFTAICTPDQARIIGALYSEFDLKRRQLQLAEITLEDKAQEYQEPLPRTRAIAAGSNEITIAGTHVSYYARFLVWFAKPPEYDKAGNKVLISLSFQETTKLLA